MVEIIPFVLVIMILYDLSGHIFSTLIHLKLSTVKSPLGMYKLMDKYGGKSKKKRQMVYDSFWVSYWGIAFILSVIYLLFK